MKRILTSIVIMASAAVAGACTEESDNAGDILGVEPVESAFQVRIAGPAVIRESGSYTWHAELHGNDGGADFVWEILPYGGGVNAQRRVVAAPFLEEYVDLSEWSSFEIVLTARSADQQAIDRILITICPFNEEPVDECTAKLALAGRAFPIPTSSLRHRFER
ncbi:MAG: hypothetical protein ACREL7_01155 [Longimicrobiales bacterium]